MSSSTTTLYPKLFSDLESRGIVKQITDPKLAHALTQERLVLYAGFDPTSDSLHVGSLLPLLTLKRFQMAGHRVIAVVGGATGMIGDPSGKSQERSLLTSEQIDKNVAGIRTVISRFLDFDGPNPATLTNNANWFKNLSYIDFLRDIGKHFTVNHMIAKESVRARLEDREHGISYTEFSYMLLQAYDFYHLHEALGCRLQIGGSDQWGNITAGIELIRRIRAAHAQPLAENQEVFGLTHPLVTKADGGKFGKSEQGTVWLSRDKTSPFRLYQFFVQTADADVIQLLKFFSFLPLQRISELEEKTRMEPEKRLAQKTLAQEMTRMIHGDAELEKVEKATQALFGTEIRELDEQTLLDAFSEAPRLEKPLASIQSPVSLIDLLVESGLCPSKGAARKEITGGGIYVNNERISDANATVDKTQLIASRFIVLRRGKKTYHLVRFENR